ncbi:MAG: hypothetical protein ABIA04_02885 [Pseudomonadota bacterium]
MSDFGFKIVVEESEFKDKYMKVQEIITKIFDEATKKYKDVSYEDSYDGTTPLKFDFSKLNDRGVLLDYELPSLYKNKIIIIFYYEKSDLATISKKGILKQWFLELTKLKPIEIFGGMVPIFSREEHFYYVKDFETFLHGTIIERWRIDVFGKLIEKWKENIIGNQKLIKKIKDFLIEENVIQPDGSLIFIVSDVYNTKWKKISKMIEEEIKK